MIIAVDFDGTCVDHRYPEVGNEAPGAVDTMLWLVQHGHKLILWTMRDGKELEDAKHWFALHGIELWGVQRNPDQDLWTSSPKAYAHVYIDDAAFGCPLVDLAAFHRQCVDWKVVRRRFEEAAA